MKARGIERTLDLSTPLLMQVKVSNAENGTKHEARGAGYIFEQFPSAVVG